MKFEVKNLSPVAFHALTCAQVSVSIQCFDWSKMAAEGFPVARIDEYTKPCEPAIHVLRSVILPGPDKVQQNTLVSSIYMLQNFRSTSKGLLENIHSLVDVRDIRCP